LRQMRFAAESYLRIFGVKLQPMLAVASVSGNLEITDWIALD